MIKTSDVAVSQKCVCAQMRGDRVTLRSVWTTDRQQANGKEIKTWFDVMVGWGSWQQTLWGKKHLLWSIMLDWRTLQKKIPLSDPKFRWRWWRTLGFNRSSPFCCIQQRSSTEWQFWWTQQPTRVFPLNSFFCGFHESEHKFWSSFPDGWVVCGGKWQWSDSQRTSKHHEWTRTMQLSEDYWTYKIRHNSHFTLCNKIAASHRVELCLYYTAIPKRVVSDPWSNETSTVDHMNALPQRMRFCLSPLVLLAVFVLSLVQSALDHIPIFAQASYLNQTTSALSLCQSWCKRTFLSFCFGIACADFCNISVDLTVI